MERSLALSIGGFDSSSESTPLGLNFEWVKLGKAEVRTPNVRGSYERDDLFIVGLTLNGGTSSGRDTLGLDEG